MAERTELIAAANMLKEHCDRAVSCSHCLFYRERGDDCILVGNKNSPALWELPKSRRFTDEDIALAKALKAVGAGAVGKADSEGFAFWTTRIYTVDEDLPKRLGRDLPEDAFASTMSSILSFSNFGRWSA